MDFRRNSGDPPLTIPGGAHHREPHLDHQHNITLQEDAIAPTLSPPAEKSKSPSTHPHHFLQGNRADQLYHCLVQEL